LLTVELFGEVADYRRLSPSMPEVVQCLTRGWRPLRKTFLEMLNEKDI
jgi:hypothetical protein